MSRMWSIFSKRPNLNSSMPQLEGPFAGDMQQSPATPEYNSVERDYSRSPDLNRVTQSSGPQALKNPDSNAIIVNNERYQICDDIDDSVNGVSSCNARSEMQYRINRDADYNMRDRQGEYDRENIGYSVEKRFASHAYRGRISQSRNRKPLVRFKKMQKSSDEDECDLRDRFACKVVGGGLYHSGLCDWRCASLVDNNNSSFINVPEADKMSVRSRNHRAPQSQNETTPNISTHNSRRTSIEKRQSTAAHPRESPEPHNSRNTASRNHRVRVGAGKIRRSHSSSDSNYDADSDVGRGSYRNVTNKKSVRSNDVKRRTVGHMKPEKLSGVTSVETFLI